MLLDPKWNETKGYVFNLDNLITWLGTRPDSATYCYPSPHTCMVGQWVQSVDPNAVLVADSPYTWVIHGKVIDLAEFDKIAYCGAEKSISICNVSFKSALKAAINQR